MECTSIFGFGSYPPRFTHEIPSKFHPRFPPIFCSMCHKIPLVHLPPTQDVRIRINHLPSTQDVR